MVTTRMPHRKFLSVSIKLARRLNPLCKGLLGNQLIGKPNMRISGMIDQSMALPFLRKAEVIKIAYVIFKEIISIFACIRNYYENTGI